MTDSRNDWPRRHRSRVDDSEPDDRLDGQWPRDLLLKMDKRFQERLAAAIASGREHVPTKSEPTNHHRW